MDLKVTGKMVQGYKLKTESNNGKIYYIEHD